MKNCNQEEKVNGKRSLREYLFKDKRKYTKRLQLAVYPVFAFFFTFFFFGPVEIFLSNSADLPYELSTFLLSAFVPFLLLGILFSLILPLIKGRTFNFVLGLVLSFTVAGYIQGNLMNKSFSDRMTGDVPDWKSFTGENILTLAIWIAVIVAVSFILIKFRRHYYRYITLYSSLFLIVIQLVGGFSSILNYKPNEREYQLLKTGEFTYSSQKNTLVFLLDRFDYDYVMKVLKEDASYFDDLDGFTSFTNCISIYARTKPAANAMLTSSVKDIYLKPPAQFYDDSWTEKTGKSILTAIKETGCNEAIYGDYSDFFNDASRAELLDNISTAAYKDINYATLFLKFAKASAYRYAPGFVKPAFWYTTDFLTQGASVDDSYIINDSVFFDDLIADFTISEDSESNFKFYHLNGPHAPYTLDENGLKSDKATSVEAQTKGVFTILRTLFEKMKQAGIYNDAEIIITADHGNAVSDRKPLTKATCIALFYKPSGS